MLLPSLMLLVFAFSGIGYYMLYNFNLENSIGKQAEIEKKLPINAGYCVEHYDIEMEHSGGELKGTISFKLTSKDSLFPSQLKFYFNNGLKVDELKINDNKVGFVQELNMLSCKNQQQQADSLMLALTFHGTPNDKLAYFDLSEETRSALHRLDPLLADKKSCFSTSDYLLLTKESFWYPVVAERNALRTQNFFTYNMKVKSNDALTFLAQGEKTEDGEWTCFNGDKPYTKLSLLAGNYIQKTIEVDSVDYSVCVRDGGFFFERYFENLSDTLPSLIREIKSDYERKLGVSYPYNRLSLVEVPVHFQAHYRGWSLVTTIPIPKWFLCPKQARESGI